MRLSLVGLTGLLAACTAADTLRVDPPPRPFRSPADVAVILEEPTRPYESIAMVEVSGNWASLARMGRRLAKEAARLGGDAVIITRRSTQSGSTLVPVGDSFLALDTSDSRLIGKVIVYREPSRLTGDLDAVR